jgi:transposase
MGLPPPSPPWWQPPPKRRNALSVIGVRRGFDCRYVREVADLPWMGCAVRLELHVRRFFCTNQDCARQIFTERLPNVVAPYARRTTRLSDILTLIGFADSEQRLESC